MSAEVYAGQVRLLMRILPLVSEEPAFALKGGTGINLFYRDLPRLSVDIDLTYLPIEDRALSLTAIDEAFDRITARAGEIDGVTARRADGGGGEQTRILVRRASAQIKIETSPVMRGTLFPPNLLRTRPKVDEAFGFAETSVVSFRDLFAGKLVAALDRQHPRDLFDVKLLYDAGGLTDDLFRAFLVYLTCSRRPPHELLAPNFVALQPVFEREFFGMTADPVDLANLETTREKLVKDIRGRLKGEAAEYLRSLSSAEPDFELIGLPQAGDLPAIAWKVQNLDRLKQADPDKFKAQAEAVEELLG